jgi:hypothetical protein
MVRVAVVSDGPDKERKDISESDIFCQLILFGTMKQLNLKLIVLTGLPCWISAFQPAVHTGSTTAGRRLTSSCSMVASSKIPDTSAPPHPGTFSGLVERALLNQYEEKDIHRILTSWRLLDKDYFHKEYVGEPGQEEGSDMYQECHSYVPGLQVTPFWDPKDFEWAEYLESKYPQIRKEFLKVNKDMQELKEQGNNIWAGALTDDAAAYGEGWTTLVLMDRGRWDPINANLFPKTAKAVFESGVPATEVFFAKLDGPSEIKKHTDFTNFVLTSHLALDIPYSGQNKCRISVGDETNEWINGNVMVLDTSLLHDAVNESDKTRYILMLRLWHPSLTEIERNALQFTFDCLATPELLSEDPGEVYQAERIVEASRTFPEIKSQNLGFGAKKNKGKKKKGGGKKAKGFGV